ncbi:hypothetical protein MKX03_011620 [Papaver bracteatum]|nr:hypothetical protein MKX03_011620 [Papaver bracteatum]
MATFSKLLKMFIVLNMIICIQHLVVSGRRISKEEEEDIEIQEQLKILNKPPIKTIKMSDGEIVDCIDENKQPAFDHPMLKNHKIRSRPSSPPNEAKRGASSSSSPKMVNLRRVKCPKGTVPIRRTSKEDLIRAKSFMESFEPISHIINPDEEEVQPPGQHEAAFHNRVQTDPQIHEEFYGIKGKISVENLSLGLDQFSASLLWIESGPQDDPSAIQAGLVVSPTLFGDNKTHVFGYWWGSKKGCLNIRCSGTGFVQTHQDYYLGEPIEPASQYDGEQHYFGAFIHEDGGTGDWWFTMYGDINADFGYWPREVVPYLGTGATAISWGGLVYNTPNETSPPMGNGYFPDGDFKKVAAIYDMHFIDENHNLTTPHIWKYFGIREDREDCYRLTRNNYDDDHGFSVFFGGPGGNCD